MYQPQPQSYDNAPQYAPKPDPTRPPTRAQAYALFLTILVLNLIGQTLFTLLFTLIFKGFRIPRDFELTPEIVIPTLILSEILFIALPVIIFCRAFGYDLRATLHLNPTSWRAALPSMAIGLLAWPLAISAANVTELLLSNLFGPLPNVVPPPQNLLQALLYVPTLTLVPGICEEMLNRGVLQRSFKGQGLLRTVLYVGLFFGLFHLGLRALIYTALLGGILAFIVYRTGSIYNSMLTHAFFNAISAVLLLLEFLKVIAQQPDVVTTVAPALSDLFPLWLVVLLLVSIPLLYLALRFLPRGPHSEEAAAGKAMVADVAQPDVAAALQPAPQQPDSRLLKATGAFTLAEGALLGIIGLLFVGLSLVEVLTRLYQASLSR